MKQIYVQMYQPSIGPQELRSSTPLDESPILERIKSGHSNLDKHDHQLLPLHLRTLIGEPRAVPYTFDDTMSSLIHMSLISLGLIEKGADLISTVVSTCDGQAARLVAKLYDSDHIQMCMLQEIVKDRTYYIDIVDEEMALVAMRMVGTQMAQQQPKLYLSSQKSIEKRILQRQKMRDQGEQNGYIGSYPLDSSYITQEDQESYEDQYQQNKQFQRRASQVSGRVNSQSNLNKSIQNAARRDSIMGPESQSGSDSDNQSNYTMTLTSQKNQYKVALLGDQRAGKTCFVNRFLDSECYSDVYQETLIDYHQQIVDMLDKDGRSSRKVTMVVKDFGSSLVNEDALEDQDAYLVCYDVTNSESFFSVAKQARLLLEMFQAQQAEEERMLESGEIKSPTKLSEMSKPIVFVGLKADLALDRAVDFSDCERTAEAYQAPYIEVSAKQGVNVEEAFNLVLTQIFKQEKRAREGAIRARSFRMNSMKKQPKEDGGCCSIF